MSDQLIPIDFRGDMIFAVQRPDGVFIVAKPIAERFGLNWPGQYTRLKDDPVLGEGIETISIPSPGGMQDTTCLRLDLLNGWLFKIDPRRVKEAAREALIAYQRECYAVLFRHFQPTAAEGSTLGVIPAGFDDPLGNREWLALIREARLLGGIASGRRMWALSPLPPLNPRRSLSTFTEAEGRECLRDLLVAGADLLAGGDDTALAMSGLRLIPGGLFVANGDHPLLAGSRWAGGAHRAALITLPEVYPDGPRTLAGHGCRGVVIPDALIGETAHV